MRVSAQLKRGRRWQPPQDEAQIAPESSSAEKPAQALQQPYPRRELKRAVFREAPEADLKAGRAPAGRRHPVIEGPYSNGGADTFLQFVEQAVQRSLAEEKGNPQKSLTSLARLLRNTGVEKILRRFPAERHDELRQMKPEQLAAEYMQDTALQLAGTKLQAATESSRLEVEEEVLHVLARSLEATHMADRLAQKLAKFVTDFAVPPHIQLKIREELEWTSLNGIGGSRSSWN